jgi:hypothetical protein
MIDANDVLVDDRPVVELLGDVVGSRASGGVSRRRDGVGLASCRIIGFASCRIIGFAHHLDRPAGALREQHRAFGQIADRLRGRIHESIPAYDLCDIARAI